MAVTFVAGVVARYTSGVVGTGPADMQVVAINGGVPHDAVNSESSDADAGLAKGGIVIWVNEAFSRGQLKVTSTDSWIDPTIEENMLSDSRDLERLRTRPLIEFCMYLVVGCCTIDIAMLNCAAVNERAIR